MLYFGLVLEGNRTVMVQTVDGILFAQRRVFNEQAHQGVGLKDFFELATAAVLGLFLKGLEDINGAAFVVAGLEFDLSKC